MTLFLLLYSHSHHPKPEPPHLSFVLLTFYKVSLSLFSAVEISLFSNLAQIPLCWWKVSCFLPVIPNKCSLFCCPMGFGLSSLTASTFALSFYTILSAIVTDTRHYRRPTVSILRASCFPLPHTPLFYTWLNAFCRVEALSVLNLYSFS